MEEEKRNQDELIEEESFEELLEKSLVKPARLKRGQKVSARIVKITDELIFLDLGGKSEGYLDRKELQDPEGNLPVQEGDTIQAYFLSSDQNEQRFTTKIGGEAARSFLEEARESGIPVEGFVEKEIKGGFEVKIAGSMRAFCPYSQMGLQRVENAGIYVGQKLPFKITDYGDRGRNIILSNRAVLEEERRARKEALKASLQEGMTVRGTITSIRNFGAFADIGGLEGLIPISEIGWGRVEDVHDVLTVGQEVEVVIMKLDWAMDRFSFSIKKALSNPWENAAEKFPEGSTHMGKVSRLTNFGAFVTLEEGIDGLVHISKLGAGKRIHHPRDVVSVGQSIEVKVQSVDQENKRLSLALVGGEREEEAGQEKEEDYLQYAKESPKSMGTLGEMLKAQMEKSRKR